MPSTKNIVPDQDQPKSTRRILLADDETSILEMSAELLARQGYQVDTATDGQRAWEALKTGAYDLLITDHNMPRLSGLELVRKMRAAHMTVPVIMISGVMPSEAVNRESSLQIEAALFKPFSLLKLLEVVTVALCRDNHRAAVNGGAVSPVPAGGS